MKCVDCGKELIEAEATTYLKLSKEGGFVDYARILCKICLEKRKKPIS